jgi:hypothetical protein
MPDCLSASSILSNVREGEATQAFILVSYSSVLSTKKLDGVGKLMDQVWDAIFFICFVQEETSFWKLLLEN